MTIAIVQKSGILPAGAEPSAPTRTRKFTMTFEAADVYTPGGINIAAAFAAAFPGETLVAGGGLTRDLATTTVRFFEVKQEAASACLISAHAETFALTDGQVLVFAVDGGVDQTATFNTGDFVDIANATAAEVCIVINADTTGCTATACDGKIVITSDTKGTGSSLVVNATLTDAVNIHITGSSTGTGADTPRVMAVEESAGTWREVLGGADLSAHSPVDLTVFTQ